MKLIIEIRWLLLKMKRGTTVSTGNSDSEPLRFPAAVFSCSPMAVVINLPGILRFRDVYHVSVQLSEIFFFDHSILLFSFSGMQLQ
jgi:hypothetical protein